jgi:hypothetical protein
MLEYRVAPNVCVWGAKISRNNSPRCPNAKSRDTPVALANDLIVKKIIASVTRLGNPAAPIAAV